MPINIRLRIPDGSRLRDFLEEHLKVLLLLYVCFMGVLCVVLTVFGNHVKLAVVLASLLGSGLAEYILFVRKKCRPEVFSGR